MACTATATPKVIQDIQQVLRLKDSPCHVASFNRENIFYKVRYKDALEQVNPTGAVGDLVQFIQKQHNRCQEKQCSGIIYVHSRQETEQLARQIHKATNIRTAAYHAGLKAAERTQVQQKWTCGEIPLVVATIAFGMGIDRAFVRYVVHWNISKTVEGFYQVGIVHSLCYLSVLRVALSLLT